MRKILLLGSVVWSMLFATLSNADSSFVLMQEDGYGDTMGSSQTITKKSCYFYDATNQLLRKVEFSVTDASAAEISWTPTYVYYWDRDEAGNLSSTYKYQYNMGKEAWSAVKDSTEYFYDDAGHLVLSRSFSPQIENRYTWEGNNMLREEVWRIIGSDDTLSMNTSKTYSEFLPGVDNKPQRMDSWGKYSSSVYDEHYTYDENYRMTESIAYKNTGKKKSKDTYVYDDKGICLEHIKYSVASTPDTFKLSSKEVRTPLANDEYELRSYSWSSGKWTGKSTWTVLKYRTIDSETAPRNLVLNLAPTAENPCVVEVSCDAPVSPVANAAYIVWRSYEAVDTVTAVDGKIKFVDTAAPIGHHSYFVQSYDMAADVAYNCTSPASIDVDVDLAPVANVRFAGGRKGKYTDPETNQSGDCYFVTVKWDAPVSPYPVTGYKVYEKGYKPILVAEVDECSVELPTFDGNSYTVRVDAVYEWGVAAGEEVTLNFDPNIDVLTRQVVVKSDKYGDAMGTTDGLTETVYYLYDADNLLSRTIMLGYSLEGAAVPMYEYFYNNKDGKLTEYWYSQYNYLGEWSKPKEYTVYTYDEKGRLTVKENQSYKEKYEYTYDEAGNLLTETKSRVPYAQTEYKVVSTKTYSGFDAVVLNKPDTMVATGQYDGDNYVEIYTYDDKYRLVAAESKYSSDNAPKDKTEYVYDAAGVETLVTSYRGMGDVFEPFGRTVRESLGNSRYKVYDESYRDGVWTNNGRYSIDTYSDISGVSAPKDITATNVSTEEAPNCVKIECAMPQMPVANAAYRVFRGHEIIATTVAGDGVIAYTDKNVKNGEYEYIVQAIDTVTGLSYNCSAPALISVMTELAPVSNLRQVSVIEGTFSDPETGEHPAYWLTFAWDAPASNYPVSEYRIYQDGSAVPVAVTTNLNDSVWIYRDTESPADQQKETTVSVVAVYEIGEAAGVEAILTLDQGAVENTKASNAYVAGTFLHVGENAKVVVYNAAGIMVAGYDNKPLIDLSVLPTGVYVARVEEAGAVQVVKIAR